MFEILEIFDRFKKLAQIFKKQSNFVNIIKQMLNTSIEIRFRELFKISSEYSRQIFCDINDEKVKAMFKKRKMIAQKNCKRKKNAC